MERCFPPRISWVYGGFGVEGMGGLYGGCGWFMDGFASSDLYIFCTQNGAAMRLDRPSPAHISKARCGAPTFVVSQMWATRLHDVCKDIEQLKTARSEHDSRILKGEDAIVAIREADKRADVMFGEIKESLSQLTRITVMVEALQTSSSQTVPRPEVEARLRAAEERIRTLEQGKA